MTRNKMEILTEEKRAFLLKTIASLPADAIDKIYERISKRREHTLAFVEKVQRAKAEKGFGEN